MLTGATNISRGWPAIQILKLSSDQKTIARSPSEIAANDVVLAALEHPPRIGETRSIAALLPDVLARYGLNAAHVQTSIDVSV